MDAILNWKGGMVFEGAGPSGFIQRMDTDASAGGVNSGARPMEMIALGLAGCTSMDVVSILQKKKQAVTDIQIHFHGERAGEHPKVFTRASLEFHFHGKELDEAAVRRAIELSVGKYCPAYAMLTKAFPIQTLYKIFDADSKALLNEGELVLQTTGA
jgi:putative redox protein